MKPKETKRRSESIPQHIIGDPHSGRFPLGSPWVLLGDSGIESVVGGCELDQEGMHGAHGGSLADEGSFSVLE